MRVCRRDCTNFLVQSKYRNAFRMDEFKQLMQSRLNVVIEHNELDAQAGGKVGLVAYGAETAGVSSKQYLRGLLFELVSAGVTSWMLKRKILLPTVCHREFRQ